MKTILIAMLCLFTSATAFCQYYTTNGFKSYEQYNGKYYLKASQQLNPVMWFITDSLISQNMDGRETWDVKKVTVHNGIKKYMMQGLLEEFWVIINGGNIILYSNGGQSKTEFRIIKKGATSKAWQVFH